MKLRPKFCPCCQGKLRMLKRVVEQVRRDPVIWTLWYCPACEVVVTLKPMPPEHVRA